MGTAHWLALAGFAAAGPLAILAPKAVWMAGVAIGIGRVLAMCGAGSSWRDTAMGLGRDLWRLRVLWLLAALGLASALWAVDPAHSLVRGLRLVLEFSVGALVVGMAVGAEAREARGFVRAAATGLVVAALIAVLDILTDGALLTWAHQQPEAIYAYGRGTAYTALAVVPILAMLWFRGDRLLALALAVACLVFVLVAANTTAKLTIALAGCGLLLGIWRWTRPLPVLVLAVGLVAIPITLPVPAQSEIGCVLMEQKHSAAHRLAIWNFADALIEERPLFGWGLEASRNLPGGTTKVSMPDCGNALGDDGYGPPFGDRMPLHPHGLALNLWLELGAVGAFLGLCVAIGWIGALARMPVTRGCVFGAFVAAAALPVSVSFGMWQGWWLTTMFVLAALCTLAPERRVPLLPWRSAGNRSP